jgi:hypothetical protein
LNSLSHEHCVRQCLRHYRGIQINCSCFIYKVIFSDYNVIYYVISQSDNDYKNDNICSDENYSQNIKLCTNLCPIDCINDEYIITNKIENQNLYSDPNKWEFTLHWDDNKPLILNKETPVMTFTDYFGYIGGLFEMWFGISANQLLVKLRDNYLM